MNIEWYRKASKKALVQLRQSQPNARLADAQLRIARDAGFSSWRSLKASADNISTEQAANTALVKAFSDALSRDRGDLEAIRALLGAHPELANCRPWRDHTAIEAAAHLCVWHRPKARLIALLLLERDATCDLPTVARAGILEEVKRRLDADPSLLDLPDTKGRTALHRACCLYGAFPETIPVAVELLRRGATVDIFSAASWMMTDRLPDMLASQPGLAHGVDSEGLTALHWATRTDSNDPREVETARLLLNAGADVEAAAHAQDGMRPLHCAAEWASSTALAALLLDRGADINARTAKWHWTPLDYAIDRNRAEMRDFLRARGALTRQELDARTDPAVNNFLRAVQQGDLSAVTAALNAQPDLVNKTGAHPIWGGKPQPLHVAIERGDRPMFELLLSGGASPDGDNALYDHWSPLMLAIHWKRREMVEVLKSRVHHLSLIDTLMLGEDKAALTILQSGPIMFQRAMPNDATMLHFVTTPDTAERLIELGVPLNAKDKHGRSALDCAAIAGHHDVVDVLADHGAEASSLTWATLGDLNALKTALGTSTPDAQLLVAAVSNRHIDVATWLLDQGLSVQTRDAKGSQATLLHLAAWNGDLPLIDLLLSRSADPTALDEEHRTTPLTWAETSRQITGNTACDAVIARLQQI